MFPFRDLLIRFFIDFEGLTTLTETIGMFCPFILVIPTFLTLLIISPAARVISLSKVLKPTGLNLPVTFC
jgi:hypothetical protein